MYKYDHALYPLFIISENKYMLFFLIPAHDN